MNNNSYYDDILKNNKGKKIIIYQSFNSSNEAKVFNGVLEENGSDYIIISDPVSGRWHLLFSRYVNYIEFEEEINIVNKNYS